VRRWRPNLADGSQRVENLISKFLNLVVAAYILATQFWTLARIRLVGFAGMLTLLTSAVAIRKLFPTVNTDNMQAAAEALPFFDSPERVGVRILAGV
jgi:hypothetical protein